MKENAGRSILMGLVGFYLLYLAYSLLKNLVDNAETTMPLWVKIPAIAAFAGIGGAFLVNAWKTWKKGHPMCNEYEFL